uniref:Dual serine/threonine and tyrosine protein kinase n=1 Tax=Sinocyclocheilus rhinocerous TaxID=307959 RepID=A0A673N731_9TELE
MEKAQKNSPLVRDLTRAFSHFNKHNVFLKKNLKETLTFFREIRQNHSNTCSSTPGLSCISLPRHEEDYLQNVVGSAPYILILGQDCSARYQLLNCLLGERLLPLGSEVGGACGLEGGACRRRKLCFTHGRQTRLSLALPGQYELVHQLAAHCGRWDTVPCEDLEIQECEDPAQRLAELEVTLHHALLQEVKIMVLPCRGVQPVEEALEDCKRGILPIILYAISKDALSAEQVSDLQKVREMLPFPVCFVRAPSGPSDPGALHRQLLSLELVGAAAGNCACGAPAQTQSILGESLERLQRVLGPFTRQLLQNQQVEAATLLNAVQCRCLDLFINQAFDMQRDLQITPRRLEYTREKEGELFSSLMAIANRKQEEMKDMIVETLSGMKEQLLEDAANLHFSGQNTDYTLTITVFSIITVLLKCAGNVLKVLTHKSLHHNFIFKINKQQLKLLFILNAAYNVEVTFHSGSSVTRLFWEQIKQIIHRITWVNPPSVSAEWKRKVAQDAIESLSAAKLAKSICSQFRTRLNSSHEAFAASLRQVILQRVLLLGALADSSRSLRDILLHGKPKMGRELGRGQYGVVYLCDSWGGRHPCALKSVVPPDDKHWNDLALEFHYTRSLPKHDRLVNLHGSVIDHSYSGGSSIAVLLIMERLHRDLYTGLKAGLSLKERLQIALDVVEGIRFLHSQGLLHRDIKLKNVLLDRQNRAKITDLGFCKPEAMISGSIVGTPIHMAPELFTGKYDNSVDVYAFGILFWYLCSGSVKLPEAFEKCSSKDQLWTNVKKGSRPERLATFDEECWQLMEACWNRDPSQRPLLGIVQPSLQSIMDRLCDNSDQKSGNLEDSN